METIRKHRKLALLGSSAIVVSLAALFIFSSFVFPAMQTSQQNQTLSTAIGGQLGQNLGTALHPILTVKVFNPDGSLAAERVEKDDLIMSNFVNFTNAILGTNAPVAAQMHDGSNTKRSNIVSPNGVATNFFTDSSTYCTGSGVTFCGAGIEVGTGSTAPTRSNYALVTPFMGFMPTGNSGYDPSTGNVTVSASEVATSGATITESGLFFQAYTSAASAVEDYLLFRDTFTGVGVTTGQTISVQYTFELLNTAFTNNFGCLMSEYLSSAYNALPTACNVNIRSGTSYQIAIWSPSPTTQGEYAGIVPFANYPFTEVGTGSTAQARTFTALATSTCSTQQVSSVYTTTTTTIKMYATNNCAGSVTITEADFMVYCYSETYSYAAGPVMLWRTTFSGVSITGSGSISITFNLVFN
jgi:hypothetical protein